MATSVIGRRDRQGMIAIVCMALIAALWVAVSAQTTRLRLVSTVWPPFTNATGQARFALDLVEAATSRFGLTATTELVDPAAFTASLLTGPFNGSAAAWKDADRERVLLFSQPYLENRLILVGKKGADVSARVLGELRGKRIAIVEGYSYGDGVEKSGPTFVRARSEEDSLQRMLQGAADYTLMDDLVVQYLVEHYAEQARTKLQFGSTPLITRQLHFAVRRNLPGAESIIDRFNAQLRTMIADRTYHRLLHVDWIRADIDGDGVTENVPASDRVSPLEPQRTYTLVSPTQAQLVTATQAPASTTPSRETPQRFYVGGNIYESWAKVPQAYKSNENMQPDASQRTASLFTFRF
jgi:polar amino acid transport system substrate-binding protein